MTRFFMQPLADADREVASLIDDDIERQQGQIELIAAKNYMSRAVFEAHSSMIALVSVEGYPGRRMHTGTAHLDRIEEMAVDRAKALFACRYANVQPHSGTQANQAVFFALLQPGDTVLSLALSAGGHLSHGLRSNFSGRYFKIAHYNVRPADGLIDYDQVESVARTEFPKLIIAGGSSYPRGIDCERLREIADGVGAFLLIDISHFSAQVAAGIHAKMFPYAHMVTMATNKSLRGPRGGLILSDDLNVGEKIDRAVFPGLQGGPLPEMICAKAVAFGEALQSGYAEYAMAAVTNARQLATVLADRGYMIVTGGTDTPIVMVDLRDRGITGDVAERALERAGITSNRNLVPGDPQGPSVTSGLRFGTSAITTRGLRDDAVAKLSQLVADVVDSLPGADKTRLNEVADSVRQLTASYPMYGPTRTADSIT